MPLETILHLFTKLLSLWVSTMVYYCIGASERRPIRFFLVSFFSLLRLQEAKFDASSSLNKLKKQGQKTSNRSTQEAPIQQHALLDFWYSWTNSILQF